ncbi:hypothetical protein [Streptomyces zaomyceticus]|uniref:hypothetical protein n=1 Tax=Streptomyces zaomyceticus TaxID=68286 RepID=UPI00342FD3B5
MPVPLRPLPGEPALRRTGSLRLSLRSRALPGTLAPLFGTAAIGACAARWLESLPDFDRTARLPVVVFGPLLAAAAIGTSLYAPSDELDRTAVRAW